MRFVILFMFIFLHPVAMAAETENGLNAVEKRLFVSFSMPETLLSQSFGQAERLHVTVVFNGLIDNSMPKTALRLSELVSQYPELSIQIDPVAFEDFGIDAVPALVVSQGPIFDVVRGNLSLSDALALIHERGQLKGKVL
ncbi:type-F conjugative transfer system pilin assembly protein TrbC (plasmid) [Legionella israelensis]|uniref:type-F conjugative transfer system pilin assembly protein TrbC n=1 Tax=Legionella israelensis TaxID=454 RepID=UPI00117CDACD|nr:type-F conjugative transfer system pilin assembly protein TrbC [Legionella israelensis]QDP73725.1 type-F conjugative transfer system pilin assembly protein TrbC [Legionella israelensis]